MKRKDYDFPEFDMYSFGRELCDLTKYKQMYYDLEEDYKDLQNKYQELLNSSIQHNQHMMGNFLELALYGIGGKPQEEQQ